MRAVIVEDEPLAREVLRDCLEGQRWLIVCGEAGDGPSAIRTIDTLRPDVVFLDVELPECSGLSVIEHCAHKPAIVFVSAYDQYAITAFDLEAIDYLLKPFGPTRFADTLRRIERHFAATAPSPPSALTRLFLRKRNEIVPVSVSNVTRLAAEGDYTRVFVEAHNYLSRLNIGEFERRIAADRFVRVHRSLIVNLDYVQSISPDDERRLRVRMRDGFEATASRSGSQRLRRFFT